MATIQEIRQKYPQYSDLSDQQLADALYRKYYSDMPRPDFDARIGLVATPDAAASPDSPDAQQGVSTAQDVVATAGTHLGHLGAATLGFPGELMALARKAGTKLDEAMTAGLKAILPERAGAALDEYMALSQRLSEDMERQYGSSYEFFSEKINPILPTYQPQTAAGQMTRLALDLAIPVGQAANAARIPVGARQLADTVMRTREIAKATTKPEGLRVAEAAERVGVEPMAADIGGPMTRRLTATAAQSPLSAAAVGKASERARESAAAVATRIARDAGEVSDAAGAGEALQRGARAFQIRTQQEAQRLYDAALKSVKPDTPVVIDNTIDAMMRTEIRLDETPEIARILQSPQLRRMAGALVRDAESGAIPLDAARRLRTEIGKMLQKPVLESDINRADVEAVYAALSQDIERAVEVAAKTGAAPENAPVLLNRANSYYRARKERIEGALTAVLGKDGEMSPEQAWRNINRMASQTGGDVRKLQAVLKSLPAEDRGVVRATIIDRLGKATPGQQDAAGDAFSISSWGTNWNRLSPRAKDVLFGGPDSQLRRDLDDLATVVVDGMKEAQKYANVSNTGSVVSTVGTLGLTAANPAAGLGLAAAQFTTGRLMSSPRYVRWLTVQMKAKHRKLGSKAAASEIRKLDWIARAEPAVAQDIARIQEALWARHSYGQTEENEEPGNVRP